MYLFIYAEQLLTMERSLTMRNYSRRNCWKCPCNATVSKAQCTCPASELSCYHILAAKMSIGMEDKSSLHKVNLTMLRKNT